MPTDLFQDGRIDRALAAIHLAQQFHQAVVLQAAAKGLVHIAREASPAHAEAGGSDDIGIEAERHFGDGHAIILLEVGISGSRPLALSPPRPGAGPRPPR